MSPFDVTARSFPVARSLPAALALPAVPSLPAVAEPGPAWLGRGRGRGRGRGPTARSTAAAGVVAGSLAMISVGGSAAVSTTLDDAPLFIAQAVRYAAACLLLLVLARIGRRRIVMPRGGQWAWLLGVAAAGLVLFNVGLVRAAGHAEPAVLGVAVASVPLLLAVVGPLLDRAGRGGPGGRRRPTRTAVGAALVVTAGAALVQGVGHCDLVGLGWAVVVLLCEAGFTLLAMPVLGRLGPWGLSVHTTWLAAGILAVLGVADDGPTAVLRLHLDDLLAVAYLAVVTALAFVLWYFSVGRLGPGRAGLLTGVAPVSAAVAGVLLGGPLPRPAVWLGIAVVAAGVALGLRGDRPGPPSESPSPRARASCRRLETGFPP